MKVNQAGGHLDQMMRQTRQHHVQLSAMADLKANMLLTMSSVIVTLTASHLDKPHFRIAGLTLIAFCLATMGLAAFVAMPKLPSPPKPGTRPDIQQSGFNLLFFGDFSQLSYDEFESAMETMMNDPSLTYRTQVREVYTLGRFLATKKYRYLRFAYQTFFSGLALSCTLAVVEGLITRAPHG